MHLKYLFPILFLVHASSIEAKIMEDKAQKSIRGYVNSAHIENPSGTRDQRYGLSLAYIAAVPSKYFRNSVQKRWSYAFDLNIEPDLKKKSGEVNILQDFYSMNALIGANYVCFFRFQAFAGPGFIISRTRANILNTKDTHNVVSPLASGGIAIDYAVNSHWELGWRLEMQYRFRDEKSDWRHGFGVIYNI